MIDIKELREAIQTFGSQAINEGDLNELLDRLEAAEKERDALNPDTATECDAARYRWLRDHAEASDWEMFGYQDIDHTDAAIDAAMGTVMSKQIHVGCSPLTGTIFAGTVLKDGRTWGSGKQDVTLDALVAVAEHVVRFGKPVEIMGPDGKLEYRITVEAF